MIDLIKTWGRCISISVCVALMPLNVEANAAPVLRVGVVTGSPFAIETAGHYEGLVIELWQNVADDNHWAFQYVRTGPDVDHTLQQLRDGQYDVVIGPLSVTQQRLTMMDFSRPYFINNIGVLAPKSRYHLIDLFSDFLPDTFICIILLLAASFFIYISMMWIFERGKHPDVHKRYHHAIRDSFWLHLIKGGFNETPYTTRGKVTVVLWVVWLALMISVFNASISAAFTVSLARQRDRIETFADLTKVRVIGVQGQVATQLARKNGLFLNTLPSLGEAVNALQGGRADAVVFDTVRMQDYLNANQINNLVVSDFYLGQEEYAFALPNNSPYRHGIDITLAKLQDAGLVSTFCQKYIGNQAKYCQI